MWWSLPHCLNFFCASAVISTAHACFSVGSDSWDPSDNDFTKRNGLFLNLRDPSKCNGTVVSWHLHYESSNDRCERSRSNSVTLSVYRPTLSNHTMSSSYYELVSGSNKSVALPCHDRMQGRSGRRIQSFMETLSPSERFVIQKDDIVAVCLPRKTSRHIKVLNELDEDRSKSRDNSRSGTKRRLSPIIYEYRSRSKDRDIDACVFDSLQIIQSRDLQPKRNSHLHLYANITGIILIINIPRDQLVIPLLITKLCIYEYMFT